MKIGRRGFIGGAGAGLLGAALPGAQGRAAAALQTGTLRVAILNDVNSFDPQAFSSVNFPVIKNLFDSLIEYTPTGEAVPSLASAWKIAADNKSVALTLRDDVKFTSGTPFDSAAVAATLKKAANPVLGKNVYSTMGIVQDWKPDGAHAITINFKQAVPTREITDLLEFISVIDPANIASVVTKPVGSGPFTLAGRVLGQRITLAANPHYWRAGEPILKAVDFTVFSSNDAADAALESGAVDMIYGGGSRSAVRLHHEGYQLVTGPGALVQVFRINATKGPFRNANFRQAFNYLMDRKAILKVGYDGLGEVTALPWAPISPAADPSYNTKYAFDLTKAEALLKASGLSSAEMDDWTLLTEGDDQQALAITQIVQSTLAKVGIHIKLTVQSGSEYIDSLLGGKFYATFGGVGNVQKFPSRLTTNSIYRTTNNPVLGNPNPFPAYVAAIDRVNTTLGPPAAIEAAYANLNQVLVESAFGIATNTYYVGLIVASKKVGGIVPEIDDMLVCRTIGFVS